MKTAFITSEYNPFHRGHKRQIELLRKEHGVTHVIACMSGNFVQRGGPAVFDKYTRAELAVKSGVDLVIELPVIFAVSSAEFFASGAMSIARNLGIVDTISFGAETKNEEQLYKIAKILLDKKVEIDEIIAKSLKEGFNYPQARIRALSELLDTEVIKALENPNNILGVEYIKSQIRFNFHPENTIIFREGAGYHKMNFENDTFPSATMARKILEDFKDGNISKDNFKEIASKLVPTEILNDFIDISKEYILPNLKTLNRVIYASLINNANALNYLPESSNGLKEKIFNGKSLLLDNSYSDFITKIKSKNDTYSKISRMLIQYFLGFGEDYVKLRRMEPSNIRILSLNKKGTEIISASRKKSEIKLLHSYKNITDPFIEADQKASELYALLTPSYRMNEDFIRRVKVIEYYQ